jgi:hypothetical protein
VFEPQQFAIPELRQLLALLREAAKAHDIAAEPAVILLVTTFAPEAEDVLEVLAQVSRTLEVALPGSQAITLVVLLPPAIADDAEKVRTFEFFLRLETVLGEIPFLNIVFVNQLSMDLYTQQDAPETADTEICEVLYRQLLDSDLKRTIQEIGYAAVRNRLMVAHRKCCYSTLGVYQLIYLAAEGLEHLTARFQYELFHQGLMNVSAVTESQLSSLQARADAFVQRQIDTLTEQMPASPDVVAESFGWSPDVAIMRQELRAFNEEVRRVVNHGTRQVDALMRSLEGCAQQELLAFFPAESPAYLAGVWWYVKALEGSRLVIQAGEDPSHPSGETLFEQVFCTTPLRQTLADTFEPELVSAAAEVDVPVSSREEDTSRFDWLTVVANAITSRLQEIDPGTAWRARFCTALFRGVFHPLQEAPLEAIQANNLVGELGSAFESSGFFGAIEHSQAQTAQTEAELHGLPGRYGWFKRLFSRRREFRDARRQLESALQRLELERHTLQSSFQTLHTLFIEVMNQAVIPYVIRTQIVQKFRDEVQQAARHFSTFVTALSQPLDEHWQRVRVLPEYSTSIAATVLTLPKADLLYQRVLAGTSMTEHVKKTLAFLPELHVGDMDRHLSYRDCHDLRDHYVTGYASLRDHLQDYTEELLHPLHRLHIIDILELEGKEASRQYLTEKVSRAKEFLGFSPGMQPLVDSKQVMNTIFVVRTSEAVHSRLVDGYNYLLQPGRLFIDTHNPHVLHITCLISGFPAFCIHALHEGRRLAIDDNNSLSTALWPQ